VRIKRRAGENLFGGVIGGEIAIDISPFVLIREGNGAGAFAHAQTFNAFNDDIALMCLRHLVQRFEEPRAGAFG